MKIAILLFFNLIILGCTAQETIDSYDREIVFQHVNVLPMDKEQILTEQTIVVKNGRIVSISNTNEESIHSNAHVINAKGKYLMPGLAEMHAHVPPVSNMKPMIDVVTLFALKGVTTIRGMLGHPLHLELRQQINNREILGPRLITSGPSFNGQTALTPEATANMVKQQKEAGYDFLKLHPGIPLESFNSLVKTAKEQNIPFAGHVPFSVGIWRAIRAGFATIDHLDGIVEGLVPGIENTTEQQNGLFGMFLAPKVEIGRLDSILDALRSTNTWLVPTQALAERWFTPNTSAAAFKQLPEMKYIDTATLNGWERSKNSLWNNAQYEKVKLNQFIELRRHIIKTAQNKGVGILLGSDAPQVFDVPGFSAHQELEYMVNAGLTPYEALQTGTINVGKFLNDPFQGVIKVGAVADLILLHDNPLVNISNTQKISGVLIGGKYLDENFIESELKKLEKH